MTTSERIAKLARQLERAISSAHFAPQGYVIERFERVLRESGLEDLLEAATEASKYPNEPSGILALRAALAAFEKKVGSHERQKSR